MQKYVYIVSEASFCTQKQLFSTKLEKTRIFAIFSPLGHKPPGAYFGQVLGLWPEMLKISLLGAILARFTASGQKCSKAYIAIRKLASSLRIWRCGA